jgi:hypothetical protein
VLAIDGRQICIRRAKGESPRGQWTLATSFFSPPHALRERLSRFTSSDSTSSPSKPPNRLLSSPMCVVACLRLRFCFFSSFRLSAFPYKKRFDNVCACFMLFEDVPESE